MGEYLHHIRWAAAFLAREQKMKPLSTSLCAGKSTGECFRMMREYYGSEHMKKAVLAVYEIRPDLFYLPPPELDDPELAQDVASVTDKRESEHNAARDHRPTEEMGEAV